MRKMYTYLVSPSRFELYLKERIPPVAGDTPVMRDRSPAVGAHTAPDNALALTRNWSVDNSALVGYTVNSRVVGLFGTILHYIRGVGILGDDTESGGVLVETVHGAEGQLGEKVSEIVRERVIAVPHGLVNRHSRRLVEYNYILVLVGSRRKETAVRLGGAVFAGVKKDNISAADDVDAADMLSVAGDAALAVLELFQQTRRDSVPAAQELFKRQRRISIHDEPQPAHFQHLPCRAQRRIRPLLYKWRYRSQAPRQAPAEKTVSPQSSS